jgi:DNA-binding transcriptional LysR family regulator
MRLDQLSGYVVFLAVARHESFTAAAAELDVSRSAVSQAVTQLEKRMGQPLFQRTTRSVRLTDAGRALFERIEPAVQEIRAAATQLAEHGDRPRGVLRINTSRVAHELVLRPLLRAFLAEHPGVDVEVFQDEGFVDIVKEGFDAGIRLGEGTERDMVAVRLGPDLTTAIVGSPAYFKRRQVPKTPEALAGHDCIRHRHRSTGTIYRWELERGGRTQTFDVRGRIIVNEASAAVGAALDGLGLAYAFDLDVEKLVAAGKLRRVLEEYSPRFPGFYLYYPSRRQMPTKLRAFVELAKRAARA